MDKPAMKTVKVFQYIEELDSFVVTEEFRQLSNELNLTEWHPTVWIGRLFTLDNDYGEHWFDNWDLREEKQEQAEALGFTSSDLMIIDPARFVNNVDGPCHSIEIRKLFWHDVLQALELSYNLLFKAARYWNEKIKPFTPELYVADLDDRIARIAARVGSVE